MILFNVDGKVTPEHTPLFFCFVTLRISKHTISGSLLRSWSTVLRKQWYIYITIIRSQFIWKMTKNRQRNQQLSSGSFMQPGSSLRFIGLIGTYGSFIWNYFFKYPAPAVLNKINRTAQNRYKPRAASWDNLLFFVQLQWV